MNPLAVIMLQRYSTMLCTSIKKEAKTSDKSLKGIGLRDLFIRNGTSLCFSACIWFKKAVDCY